MQTLTAADLKNLSRREFLRWSARGLAGLFGAFLFESALGRLPRLVNAQSTGVDAAPKMGRVLDNSLKVYSEPSLSAKVVNMYWRDLVLPINSVTVGDKEPAHNRVWYRVNDEGYSHSGMLQPVALEPNRPVRALPKTGVLGEISVPYTDSLRDPDRPDRVAYRLYYSTTHWLREIATGADGKVWYRVRDDKRKYTYYINAEHVRVLQASDIAPLSPDVPPEEKHIEVRLSQQVAVAYEGDTPVFMTRVASGGRFIEGNYSTPTGRFYGNRKRPSRHMASADLAAPSSFDLPGVPWVVYLTLSGISFHGTYWHNDFGKPRSHGCLNVSPQAAKWIYRWTDPAVPFERETWAEKEGTRIDVIE